MLYAHGRAKEHRAVRGPWPARIKPLENETLSSWLVRASLANFSSPSGVTNYIWPDWRAWTRDIDRQLSPERFKALKQVSTLSEGEINNMLLEPLAQQISQHGKLSSSSAWRWVVQRSTRNRNTVRSTQFCADCLREDVTPYLRRHWRLSFITVCTRHHVNLLDSCPHCGASVEVHKITRGKLRQCAHCRWDMSDIDTVPCNSQLLLVTKTLEQQAFGTRKCHPDPFERLTYLLTIVRRAAKQLTVTSNDSFVLFQRENKDLEGFNKFSSLSFDWLDTNDRRHLLESVVTLMLMKNEQLALSLMESGMSLGFLQNCSDTMPAELIQYFPEKRQLDRHPPSQPKSSDKKIPSRRTIERRWQAFLVKHGLDG